MTSEEWDTHYWRIRHEYESDGYTTLSAEELAEEDVIDQFGPRPGEAQ